MNIYDGMTFFNELDLLKIRLETLKGLNAIHIIVESPTTHTGDPKPLYFEENKHLFEEYDIRHVISELPNNGDAWANENKQRDMISWALWDAEDEDLVFISDLDEIPRPEMFAKFDATKMKVAGLKMNKYSYYINCLEGYQSWEIAKMTTYGHLKTTTPNKLRNGGHDTIMLDAGWHMAWLGGLEKVIEKFNAYAHVESNNAEFADPDLLKWKLENNISLWGKDSWKIVPIDETFPLYVQEHQQELIDKGLIKPL